MAYEEEDTCSSKANREVLHTDTRTHTTHTTHTHPHLPMRMGRVLRVRKRSRTFRFGGRGRDGGVGCTPDLSGAPTSSLLTFRISVLRAM
jgi:hypothetical protein